jgi:uncharacterized HAD superfamily protein
MLSRKPFLQLAKYPKILGEVTLTPVGITPYRLRLIMTQKICLDLDGIITDIGSQIKEYAEKDALEFEPMHIGEALLTPDGVDYLEFIFEDPLFWRNLLPIKESWHTINDWFMSGKDIIFVTARRSDISIGEMVPWLDNWGVMYSDIVVCDMNRKHEHIGKIKPIFYVDDNPTEIKMINDNLLLPTFVMTTWYNFHLIDDSLNSIHRLSDIELSISV